jgi:LacI family transcriptional regulator
VLGIVVPYLADLVISTLYESMESTALSLGYQAIAGSSYDKVSGHRRRINLFLEQRVDGLIIADAHDDWYEIDELARQNVPFVLASRHVRDHPAVVCDDVLGGRLAASHLVELGHEAVAVITGNDEVSTARERREGFLEGLRSHGLDCSPRHIMNAGFDPASGRRAGSVLLDREPRPTAIFAANDLCAIGVMGAAVERGLRIGHDIAIIGYNDVSIARELPVPLTTIRSPVQQMGALAVSSLLKVLAGEKVEPIYLTPELVVRESTDPSAARAWGA